MIWRFFLTIKNIKVLTPLTTPNPTPHPNPLLSYLVECDNFTPNLSSSLSKMFWTTYPGLVVGRSEGVGGKEKGGGSRGGGGAYIYENWSVYKDVYIGQGAGDYIISAIWFQSPAQFYPKIRSTSLAVLYRIYIMMQFNKGIYDT